MSCIALRSVLLYVVCGPLLVGSCTTGHTPPPARPSHQAGSTSGTGSQRTAGLAWIHDDYPTALTQAQKTKRPLMIDFWAKWCHTCWSMKQTILTDPSLAKFADRFVWLALDTDQEKNAPALARFPISAWPTFIIISAQDESVQAQYRGAASVAQFRAFLKTGEQAHLDQRLQRGQLGPADPLYYTRRADRWTLSNQLDKASVAYAKALALAGQEWERRPDVLTSLVAVLAKSERWSECAMLARNNHHLTGNSASAADFSYFAMICATKLTDQTDRRNSLLHLLGNRLKQLVADTQAPLSVDDRSEALRILREIYLRLADKQQAQQIAGQQQTLLDKAAALADNPSMAATYNWPRAEVYVFLGQGKKLIDDLKKSTQDLPNEFDPPYRAAWVAMKIGNGKQALEFAKTSLARSYGPRKLRIYLLIAEIHKQHQDSQALADTLREAISFHNQLPTGQQQPSLSAVLQTQLKELQQESPAPDQHNQ